MYYLAGYFAGSILVAFLIVHLIFSVILGLSSKTKPAANRKAWELLIAVFVAFIMTYKQFMGM